MATGLRRYDEAGGFVRRHEHASSVGGEASLDLALLLQHPHGLTHCVHGVFELAVAMGCGDEPARAAAEINPVEPHCQPQFVTTPAWLRHFITARGLAGPNTRKATRRSRSAGVLTV